MFFAAVVEKRPAWYERECSPQRIDKEIAQLGQRATSNGKRSALQETPAARHSPALRRLCLELLILCITYLDMLVC